MADANRENNISRQPIDLNQIYGIDEVMKMPLSNLEDLTGYNLTSSNLNDTRKNGMQSSNTAESMSSNLIPIENERINSNSQSTSQATIPQRQEQTFPTNRLSTERLQAQNRPSQNNMPIEKDMKTFLQKQIGQMVKVQFLIGSNTLVSQEGTLAALGDDYVILRDSNTGELLICNFDDIKFIKLKNRS